MLRGENAVQSIKEGGWRVVAFFSFDGRSLEPFHVVTGLQHVIPMPSRDGHKVNSLGIVSYLFHKTRYLFLDCFISRFRVWGFCAVHFVTANNKLFDSKSVSQESVLSSLAILCDTTFTLSLQFVEYPGVFERTFSHFLGLLLELLDGTFVDSTTFVDQMSSCGRFAGVDVTNDDNVDVNLFFSHFECEIF